MKAINIFTFTRIQDDLASKFDNTMAQHSKKVETRPDEFNTLKRLVELLIDKGVKPNILDGFFISYVIEQIGKEFDLLKIEQNKLTLNIELKSNDIGKDEIIGQLKKNQYYLKHLSPNLRLFTYVKDNDVLYEYVDSELKITSLNVLIDVLNMFGQCLNEGIESLFQAKNYLISPLTTPKKFLENDYFLTQQQNVIRKDILNIILKDSETHILGLTGKAGTGKTLLLYDIIKEVARNNMQCCVIHSGILCKGHEYLTQHWNNVTIIPAKDLNSDSEMFMHFDCFFIDEAQRIYLSSLEKVIKEATEKKRVALFAYDYEQTLSDSEIKNDIPQILHAIDGFLEYRLTNKIRTSREIASFCRTLMSLNEKARGFMDYSNIDVVYAKDSMEGNHLIDMYSQKGYVFISYTQSMYKYNSIDLYPSDCNTHHVIGQEFDKVMIMMDDNFRYDADYRIQGRIHPNPNYLFYKLLYQAISRAREKLCILVIDNYKLFEQILNIKYDMLLKYQYKESQVNVTLSIRKLNRLTKQTKDGIKTIDSSIRDNISETIDMINDDLKGSEIHRKIINCGIRLLKLYQKDVKPDVGSVIVDYCDYVAQVVKI